MGRYVTVSVKVPIELKRKMDRLGVKASAVLRRALEEEVKRREIEDIKRRIERVQSVLNRIPMDDIVKSIREDREEK